MDTLDSRRVRAFFSEIVARKPLTARPASVVVTHLLPDRPFFLDAVSRVTDIVALLPKPKTESFEVRGWLKHRFPIHRLNRDLFSSKQTAIAFLEPIIRDKNFVLIDIGGYFSPSLEAIAERFDTKLMGVVEDTENGIQKYEALRQHPCPIIHVARLRTHNQ